ncbi:peptidoglycan-binding protein [Brooklawnia cerclae]|uniref:Peptidoglycan hydrolase-like protein with peptidoglycan-binding domain n=1 Tax=Brooklawnia cerclae TaxID=349934 RepID=A0ABX0SB52_9ACTN|nr:peptidoglycan-binding domain-containing protein [Brooklawnia cerclae]NIH55617.1 peptidoglycan hydrolase-like protein with peptidoglycan-binding domain [Brooklawnia cerclae]
MRNKVARWATVAAAIALALLGGWWAGRATLASPETPTTDAPQQVTATVTQASVGQTLNYNVSVRQELTIIATNLLQGVVTSVSGGEVAPGDTVYSVANVPVRVARGSMPFYRDLTTAAEGTDVEQVQQMLDDLGYDQPVTGEWAGITTANVKAWQDDLGEEQTGIIRLGTLIAVSQLPASVAPGEAITVGAQVSGGEPGLLAYMGTPEFVISLTADQARNVPLNTPVTVAFEDRTWSALVAGSQQRDDGTTDLVLTAPDGSVVCGSDCGSLPAAETTMLPGRVQIVPEVSGPAVPAAAVRTDETGASYVLLPNGSKAPVTVLASGDGLAIVEGLDVGDQIVVLQADSEK